MLHNLRCSYPKYVDGYNQLSKVILASHMIYAMTLLMNQGWLSFIAAHGVANFEKIAQVENLCHPLS